VATVAAQNLPERLGGVPSNLPERLGGVPSNLPQRLGGVPSNLPQRLGGVPSSLPQRLGGVPSDPVAQFSSQVQLVEVYATVTDAQGESVMGLKREDFEVYENNEIQDVSTFAAGEFPLTVALGVDRSWSMAGEPLRLAKQASTTFLRALKSGDRSMVVAISNEADLIAPLTMDRFNQERAIAALDPWSTTALHDAIIAALDRLEPESGRQALVVFSDGTDRYSRASAAEVIERARRSNALIYPIAFGKTRPAFLAELAVLTGGRSFLLRDARELEKTLQTIARELRYQYLLGYAPADPIEKGEHEWRSIRVVLKNGKPGLRIRARDGYVAD
jgi:Ca-activated chloride channel family protein